MSLLPPQLVDTGESEAVPEEKTPSQIAAEADEVATVGYVKAEGERKMGIHVKSCPAMRNMRTLRTWLLVISGAGAAASVLGTVAIKAELRADRAEIKAELRTIIRQEVGDKLAALDSPRGMPAKVAETVQDVTPLRRIELPPRRLTTPPSRSRLLVYPDRFVQAQDDSR